MKTVDIAVIGAGPAGAAAAIQAARSGARVVVFEKGAHGRDKVCGDGLTPRAVGALNELKIPLDDAHQIRGLRMIAGKTGARTRLADHRPVPEPRCGVATAASRRSADGRRRRSRS